MQRYAGVPSSNHKTLTNDLLVTSDSKRSTIKALGGKLDAVFADVTFE